MAVQEGPPILKAKKEDRPNLKDIANFVVLDVCDKWYPLGLQLLDPKDESFLRALRNQSGTCLDKCTEVFQHWLDVTAKPTWNKILKALKKRSVNFPNVADKIENMLYKSKKKNMFSRGMHKVAKTFKGKQTLTPITECHVPSSSDTEPERSQATNDEEGYRSGDSENDEFSDDESNDGEERLDNESANHDIASSYPPLRVLQRSVSFHEQRDLGRKKQRNHDNEASHGSDTKNSQLYGSTRSVPDHLIYQNNKSLSTKYTETLEKLCKKFEEDAENFSAQVKNLTVQNKALLKEVENLKKDAKIAEDKQINNEQILANQEKDIQNLVEKNTALEEQVEKLAAQLEEARKIHERELSDTKFKADKETSKTMELQNLRKENEELQLHLQATKKHNRIVLGENSRIQSEVIGTYDKITQLKENMQKLKEFYCQNLQEFKQKFTQNGESLKQRVEETISLKNSVDQVYDSLSSENANTMKKVNAQAVEIEYFKNKNRRRRNPSLPEDFRY